MGLFPRKARRDLHFRALNHSQRIAACKVLADKALSICVIASNKVTILDSDKLDVFKRKGYLYNYLVQYLLERITVACAIEGKGRGGAKLRVIFSRRAGTDYQSMKAYLQYLKGGWEVKPAFRQPVWSVFDPKDISVENHSVRAGLQLADVATSATATALEPDGFGNIRAALFSDPEAPVSSGPQ